MKKTLVLVTLSLLILSSASFAKVTDTPKQLADVFNAVAKIESAAASGDWTAAQQKALEVKSMMVEIDPAVQQNIGQHAVKAITGFVVQLQKALQAKDYSAAEGPLVSLQKIKSWVPAQYLTGI